MTHEVVGDTVHHAALGLPGRCRCLLDGSSSCRDLHFLLSDVGQLQQVATQSACLVGRQLTGSRTDADSRRPQTRLCPVGLEPDMDTLIVAGAFVVVAEVAGRSLVDDRWVIGALKVSDAPRGAAKRAGGRGMLLWSCGCLRSVVPHRRKVSRRRSMPDGRVTGRA